MRPVGTLILHTRGFSLKACIFFVALFIVGQTPAQKQRDFAKEWIARASASAYDLDQNLAGVDDTSKALVDELSMRENDLATLLKPKISPELYARLEKLLMSAKGNAAASRLRVNNSSKFANMGADWLMKANSSYLQGAYKRAGTDAVEASIKFTNAEIQLQRASELRQIGSEQSETLRIYIDTLK